MATTLTKKLNRLSDAVTSATDACRDNFYIDEADELEAAFNDLDAHLNDRIEAETNTETQGAKDAECEG